jgi:hypothetical protein
MDVDQPKVESVGETVNKPEKSTTLKNVVAFVDVKTAEGDDAGGVFVDILRSLGARVSSASRSRIAVAAEDEHVSPGPCTSYRQRDAYHLQRRTCLDSYTLSSLSRS